MPDTVESLSQQLTVALKTHGPQHPQVAHLRWLLVDACRRAARTATQRAPVRGATPLRIGRSGHRPLVR